MKKRHLVAYKVDDQLMREHQASWEYYQAKTGRRLSHGKIARAFHKAKKDDPEFAKLVRAKILSVLKNNPKT